MKHFFDSSFMKSASLTGDYRHLSRFAARSHGGLKLVEGAVEALRREIDHHRGYSTGDLDAAQWASLTLWACLPSVFLPAREPRR